ncbi:MAG: TMEM43 family protein [Pseudomonadota bacterium]|nr:TMEM43 family protein [Pseudomonadota bacterium]
MDRQVEMYQWQAYGEGFQRVWNRARIESSGFPPGYENPPLPISGQRWWSTLATLDGYPIAPNVLQAIGEWHVFRPPFSRLPANLAASFQPEGDGLGSAENPLEPQVGDLRVTWRELQLPSLPGRVELRAGVWELSPQTEKAAMNAAPLPPAAQVPGDERAWLRLWPWALGAALLLWLMWLLAAAVRGRR